MNRGDVVVVPFPFQDKPGEKVRPAVIVQCDAENRRLANTVLAMITGNLGDFGQPTQEDEHFYAVCRYVERNALRANLVTRAEDWRWNSLYRWKYGTAKEKSLLSAWPRG